MLNAKTNITKQTVIEEEDLLTIKEAAAYLEISRRTFELTIQPYVNRYGSPAKWFYKKQELKSYFLSRKHKAECTVSNPIPNHEMII
jgi:5-bromo-4-chloroindolyl phosphate hydrolysis protein